VKSHFLPRCYLKGFVDPASVVDGREPYLWMREPETGKWRRRAPKNVASQPDYYATSGPAGSKNQALEESLGNLENAVAPILRHLEQKSDWTEQDTAALVAFAGIMYARLPVVHDVLDRTFATPHLQETLATEYRRLQREPEAFRRSLEACARATGDNRVLTLRAEDALRLIPNAYVKREFLISRIFEAALPEILEVLSGMRWRLLHAPPSLTFITSDLPVHIIDPKAPKKTRHHHMRSPGAMFTLPLTRNVLLLGDWGGPPSMSWAGITRAGVRDMNLRRAPPGLTLYSSEPDFLGHADLVEPEEKRPAAPAT
jgi:hypothetical protein